MGKWYSVPNYVRHKLEKKHYHYSDDPKTMEFYYPWVETIARSFPQSSIAIGSLTLNDLIQAGYVGLILAWEKVDLDKSQAEIWSFLKTRIKQEIRREIDKNAEHISLPINKLENARNNFNWSGIDKVLVNIFPSFYDMELIEAHDLSPWLSVQLESLILDELDRVESNKDHINILLKFYGIGYPDPKSQKSLAEEYKKDANNIGQIVNRTRNKLNNKEFEKIIENFYQNV